ncbi:MAG: glutamyl-Q tRNA(Asp) synthetase [Isosphaeraceae bacterium]|jgi:glutamyl-tRNA synthetase|nr:MAG: glutamyl-Q tRNA(Asp) synthetase [Isosphaeraceae bacterium]
MDAEGLEPGVVVSRLAPSPTGGLHVGHARTFLVAWWAARRRGGRVVLRIEDLDGSRTRPGMTEQAVEDLRWLGLDWDEGPDVGGPNGPYVQSERTGFYEAALERLREAERVYPCTCTRAEIARMQTAPHAGEEGPIYPGRCAGRRVGDAARLAAEGRTFAWRFRAGDRIWSWDDGQLGRVSRSAGGDFVVGRSTGEAAYQLAVVVDDAAMGVTEVVRGDDLVTSTPRQLALFEALGWRAPRYRHVPLVLDGQGRRLAKRDQAIKLASLRAWGVDPQRLVGWLAWSLGWAGRVEPSRPWDWVRREVPELVASEPWAVEDEVLGDLRSSTSAGREAV